MGQLLSIWSPRPDAPEKEELSQGVTIYGLPMIDISDVLFDDSQLKIIVSSDALLFVSQYAVKSLCSQLPPRLLANKKIIAIGEKTAETLMHYGLSVTYSGKAPFNSESLLDDEIFQSISFDSVVLITGKGGRQLLEKSLKQMNKKVYRMISYERYKCHVEIENMLVFIDKYSINSIILTSCEIVDTVVAQLQACGLQDFKQMPVFTLSQRITEYAQKCGFSQTVVAKEASYEELCKKIVFWSEQ